MSQDEKRCSTCHLMRPFTDFNRRQAAPDGRQSRCRSCARAWYEANRVSHRQNVRIRNARVRAEYRRRIGEYLLVHPCVDCGERDVRLLEFDHEDPSQKSEHVVRLASFGIAWDRVLAEIGKCSVRCANCHRRRTTKMFGYWRAGVERDRREATRATAEVRLNVILRLT